MLQALKSIGSGGIRTHASEETGALNQRLRPLGHATLVICQSFSTILTCCSFPCPIYFLKNILPPVRLELTAFRLWDWRAAYCATEAYRWINFKLYFLPQFNVLNYTTVHCMDQSFHCNFYCKKFALAGNRTRVNCLEGSYAHHYTTNASTTQSSCKTSWFSWQK